MADDLLARARAREKEHDFRGALDDYAELIKLEPANPDLLLDRGRVRLMLRDAEGARTDFLAAASARPGDARTLYYVAYAQAQSSPAGSLADYRAAAEAQPRDADGFYYRGLAHLALNASPQAHADFLEAARVAAEDDPRRELYQEKAAATEPFSLPRAVRAAPVTWALVALNVAVMLVFFELLVNPTVDALMRRGAVERYAVRSGEFWRLLTAVFLHIGPLHLAMNGWAGIALCAPVEKALGSWRFLAVYLACGVAASAVSVAAHHVVAAGASGALFGIEGVLIVALLRQRGKGRAPLASRKLRRMVWSMAIWFVIGLAAPFDNYAHAGGLAFGLLFGGLLIPREGAPSRFRKPAWALAALLWIGACVAAVDGSRDPGAVLTRILAEAESRGDLPAAEKALTAALGTGLDDLWIRVSRGSIRHRRENLAGAREDYVAVLQAREDSDALWGLGSLEAAAGRHPEAIAFYDRALRVDPKNPDVLVNRGVCYEAIGRRPEAARDFRRALEIAPAAWPHRADARERLQAAER